MKENLDWTHKDVQITDIRKLKELYAISLNINEKIIQVFVNSKIFESRLRSYYLTEDISFLSREDILKLHWNVYLTAGYFIKIDENSEIEQHYNGENNLDKWYISYLEIAGDLATFSSVYKNNKN